MIDDRKVRVSEELQQPMLERLGAARAAEVEAKRERRAAERNRLRAEQALGTAKRQFEKKAKELAQLTSANVLESVPTADIHDRRIA